MDIDKIQKIAGSLKSMRKARFGEVNSTLIGFETDVIIDKQDRVIRTSPFEEYHTAMKKELNDAILPVIKKYIQIYENELLKCVE